MVTGSFLMNSSNSLKTGYYKLKQAITSLNRLLAAVFDDWRNTLFQGLSRVLEMT